MLDQEGICRGLTVGRAPSEKDIGVKQWQTQEINLAPAVSGVQQLEELPGSIANLLRPPHEITNDRD